MTRKWSIFWNAGSQQVSHAHLIHLLYHLTRSRADLIKLPEQQEFEADERGQRMRIWPKDNLHTQNYKIWEILLEKKDLMFACEMQILLRLAVLVVCLVVAVAQIPSHHFLFQRPMSWSKAREFCQRYYVDLAVLNTEEQYFSVLNATLGRNVSFWLGLRRQSSLSNWTWVNGEELKYTHWYRRNHRSLCASLESMLDKDEKLLARFCDELHMFVCQGPLAPQTAVKAASVGNGQLNLSWNISAFMQMTPHSYNVTTCTSTCDTVLYSYTDGSAFMSVNISNLTLAPETFIHVAAFVVRPDAVTGGERILQSDPTTLHFKTADSTKQHNVIPVILKLLKIVSLVPPLWILYRIIKKGFELDHDVSEELRSMEGVIIDLIPEKPQELAEKG
ncbi:uncharacterized protein LOC117767364 isoform X2 [Hippoglossus hippoglossus]|uniref:uncharacterized protein LOC117767364 isoform X2 n=1 Tax=Hippoglossus hippoglossus TaxID=8267 RepID=UPI00148BD3C2|nr:uncharacterized protein LOC117767364 isoform X2 [Hippoglossus hippoglossus]